MAARILILSASVGSGHVRAAEAVELALRQIAPDAMVKNVDVLDLTNAAFRKLYASAYIELANVAPLVVGYVYDRMDRPHDPDSAGDKLRVAVEKLNLGPFIEMIEEGYWDVVVNTHYLPAEIIASLRRDKKVSLPQITVTTDFETQLQWVNDPCDAYTTATEEGAAHLRRAGVESHRLHVTGIPIHPVFSTQKDRATCLANQNLSGDRPIVLQLAGALGVGPMAELFSEVLDVETPLDIVVVAGNNDEARKQLEAVAVPPRHRVRVLGYTDQIDEFMQVADVVVSKPGGLTTSEVLARGAAMAIVHPIPGQETRNSDYLLESGAAIKINNTGTLAFKLGQLLIDREQLESLRASARKIARPRAAFDVAELALGFVAGTR